MGQFTILAHGETLLLGTVLYLTKQFGMEFQIGMGQYIIPLYGKMFLTGTVQFITVHSIILSINGTALSIIYRTLTTSHLGMALFIIKPFGIML